ncbi:LysM peptidoglycan-binding domain-containing protein [Parabacteroides sp. 52]|uniref:lytic transglycosylase domain-containing protein n=1 Tax=unclassified Parabacteroides TaxID=2649774 RepID=UPI0013D40FFD|nr:MULTISPECIES: lytic transglycosylase domain-containing protein [unclassified Parabacteroides]MDH6535392.1 membrane-bound lytic murein transglycosylase D [Parabacteroides sp. PM5-20]NDV55980.1 LysM peptidoglycan-binding domain-containing protein [Parabacteroides sp. 52]
MKKRISLWVCLCFLMPALQAQTETTLEEVADDEQQYSVLSTDSILTEVGLIPESLDANVDSLLRSWHVQYFAKREDFCHDDNTNVFFPDSIYQQRLESIHRIIPMTYNKSVRDCINLYTEKRRNLVKYMLGMADFYFPLIEQILDEHDLPIELKYLAVVESALNPVAVSRVGAAGLWQFMLPTGKSYGLEINSLVDERRDPLKATHAACRYFKDMYNIYGDWNLVLAAYNCGLGTVNKAIRRANGKTDFWDIFNYLPRETRSYVPLFIAANYVMNFYCEHNLCPVQTNLPLATDTIMVNKMLHFEQITDLINVDIDLLRALNPQYKRDIIPGNTKASILKLPAADTYTFVEVEDTIYTHRVDELLANSIPYNAISSGQSSTREKITHTAQAGENLYTIADRYGVTAKEIRKWNGLGSNRVGKGKRLVLYVDNGGVRFASKTQAATPTQAAANTSANEKTEKGFITYTVQSGDSLYTISKKYPGITASVLQKTNNLSGTMIRPGQKLKIPVG